MEDLITEAEYEDMCRENMWRWIRDNPDEYQRDYEEYLAEQEDEHESN